MISHSRTQSVQSRALMEEAPYLSLVIPCFNEQENIPTLLERVGAALGLVVTRLALIVLALFAGASLLPVMLIAMVAISAARFWR